MTPEIERHLSANAHISKKKVMYLNFLGGLAWGFGTVVGATVVVAIIGYFLSLFGVFDFIKFSQVPQYK
ncbi:MAG: DUF5665 domain-containing protein [Patescibacteria group bacterium]